MYGKDINAPTSAMHPSPTTTRGQRTTSRIVGRYKRCSARTTGGSSVRLRAAAGCNIRPSAGVTVNEPTNDARIAST